MQKVIRFGKKQFWFLGFTAVFAALAGFVFWGTWSTDFAPVMPDCPIVYGPDYALGTLRGMFASGKFVPADICKFLGSPYFWQELQYALALYCAALGMAYFCRGRGLTPLASYGAGLLLAFSGYWCTLFSAGHLGWFQWMTYGVFAFGLIDRAVKDCSSHATGMSRLRWWRWMLLGACVAWGSCYQADLWLLFTLLTGAYFIWCCVRERTFPWKGALVSAVVFFVVGAPYIRSAFVNDLAGRDRQIEEGQTLSSQSASTADDREKRWIFVTNWSLPPNETAEFLIPRLNGDTSCPLTLSLGARYGTGVEQYTGALGRPKDAPSGNYRQHSLYVGFITCFLALFSCLTCFKKLNLHTSPSPSPSPSTSTSDFAFFLIAAILCWLFSLGRYCEPVYRVIFALPFGDYLRAPVKWHHLTEFCLCVLAGFGIEALHAFLSRVPRLKPLALPLVVALVLWGAIDLARVDHLYCAPVDLREAKRQNCNFQMTFLRRTDFNDPQVAAMAKAKRIVALAQPNPETYLVGVLQPRGQRTNKPWPPMELATVLGFVSILGTIAALFFGIIRRHES